MSRVYILMPVHNRKSTTARFIDCLQAQTCEDYRLVLIDDGSTDGTATMVEQRLPGTVVLRADGGRWWAGSLQLGYDWLKSNEPADDEVVLIINDDTHIEPEFIATGLRLLGSRKRVMLHARCLDKQTGDLLDDGVNVDWKRMTFSQVHNSDQINCLSTRGLFLRVSDFLATGGFRPRQLPHYLSDYEFTIRAQRGGVTAVIDPQLRLWTDRHDKATSDAEGSLDGWRLLFSRKNPADPRAWLWFVLLSCPIRYMPVNLLRVCARSLVRMVRA